MARAAMNQSVFGGRGGECPVRVSPGATRAFSCLCPSLCRRPSACPSTPVSRSFPPHLWSRSFLPRQSTVQVHVPGQGRFALAWASPSWFFLVAIVTAVIPAARAHRRCCPPRGVCASAFELISAVISGWTHSSKCVQCYQLPVTVGRLGRAGYCPPVQAVP